MKWLKTFMHPDLIKGSILKTIVCFTIPVLFSYLFQQLYNTTDTVIIGNFLGENSLAAIGSSVAIYDLLVGFGIGFGNGLSIVAARAYGSGDSEKLKRVTAASLVITAGVTAAIMIIARLFLVKIMIFLDTPEEIFEKSWTYINLITLWVGVIFAYNLFAGLLRAIGNSFIPLLFLIFSSILNVILDVFFLTGTKMDIGGAAVATVISQGVSAVLCLFYIFKKAPVLVPGFRHFVPEKNALLDEEKSFYSFIKLYRELTAQGLSMALMSSLVMSGTLILQSAINGFGPVIIAGHICARKIFGLTNIPVITLGLAFSTFTSQNLGAGKIERIKSGAKWAFVLCTAYCVLMLAVMPFTIRGMAAVVSGSTNKQLLDYAFNYMFFAVLFYFPLGGIFITRNSLQGLGEKILPLISSIIELLGKILFTVLIIPRTGVWGIIVCEPVIWVVMFINLLWIYVRNPVWKKAEN